jgi:predicted nucleic acid-binding protein
VSDVFLDTVGLIAILNHTDQWRASAAAALSDLHVKRRGFITTDLIFYEAGNALSRTPLRAAVDNLRIELRDQGKIKPPSESDCELAWQLYRQGSTGGASIVDCISFAVMRRLGLAEAFTNDQHFAAAGFTPLF